MTAEQQRVEADRFREVLGSVPAPVTVVTTLHGERPHGTTVSAFSSLSLDPPLVVVSLDRSSELLTLIRQTGRFGVNVLHAGQADHALSFARKGSDKFEGVEWERRGELPSLPEASAWIGCRVSDLLPGGDHVLVTGLVEEAESRALPPLLYRERAFAQLAADSNGPA